MDYNALIEQYKKKLKSGSAIDYTSLYETAAESLMQAQNASYQGRIAALEEQLPLIQTEYDDARTDAYRNARLSAVRSNEQLAALGLAGGLNQEARSGVSETARIAADNNLRSNLNQLNADQLAAEREVQQSITAAGYENDQKMAEILAEQSEQLATFAYQKQQDDIKNAMNEIAVFGKIMTQSAADALGLPIGTPSYASQKKSSSSRRKSSSVKLTKNMQTVYDNALSRMENTRTDTYGASYYASLYGINVEDLPAYQANEYLRGQLSSGKITQKQAEQLRALLNI